MTDSPEDIRRKAGDAILAGGEVLRCGEKLHMAIAQALMEERERCIAKALGEKLEDPQDDADRAYDTAIEHVVDAIRTP